MTCETSMVMPWSCSSSSASSKNAYSNFMPRSRQMASTYSILDGSTESVSWRRRPTSVDLPWSTCPTKTIRSASSAASISFSSINGLILHVPFRAKFLHRVALGMVLLAPHALGDLGVFQLLDDLADRVRVRIHGLGDWLAAQRAVAFAVFSEVEAHDRDIFAL